MQILANGIISGLTIAVLALAYLVVFLPTRVFHVALGAIYALVPYVAWSCGQRGLPTAVAIALSLLTGALLSLGCELFNHAWLEKKQAAPGAHLISSLGVYIMIVQVAILIWGNGTRQLRQGADTVLQFVTLSLPTSQVVSAIVAVTILVWFCLWLRFSSLGLQFRALADNPKEFGLQGYNMDKLRLLAFGLSGLLASISSLLVAYDIGFDPQSGLPVLLMAIVAVIIGSQQSFVGAVLGGLVLGVVRVATVWFLSARWQEAATFLVLVFFLLIRPNGLMGHKPRVEAEV
ncbi:branched-chain amino acid ABC transporter permease protein (plasmid) [Nostoc carneum NIES-2107]|nr:branched-chain amino acid ABC transporter permease protein [Nostoc carneum NIES-2107]